MGGLASAHGSPTGWAAGDTGWFADQVTVVFPAKTIPLRMTGVALWQDGMWRLVQLHGNRRVAGLLDCGRRDEYALDIGARILVQRIRSLGLEVRHEEFDDDHRNVGYRYAVSLPALAEVLETK